MNHFKVLGMPANLPKLSAEQKTRLDHLEHSDLSVVFDIDPAAASVTRNQLLGTLAGEKILIAGPHMTFPGIGRLRQDNNGYRWEPVAYIDEWVAR